MSRATGLPPQLEEVDLGNQRAVAGAWSSRLRLPVGVRRVLEKKYAAVAVAAIAPALAYFIFVWHFAVNAPLADDWSRLKLVHESLHGHAGFADLVRQYKEVRLITLSIVFIVFGRFDHLNLRHVILLSAAAYIAAYGMMLVLFARYSRHSLRPLPVLAIGMVWFSLVQTTQALWAFQFSWYFVIFAFIVTILSLTAETHRRFCVAVAIVAVIAGSYSMIQGFLLWPVGLLCLWWTSSATRRRHAEIAVWVGIGALALALYLRGYHFGEGCTGGARNCSPFVSATHPVHASGYFLALVGSVIGGASRWPHIADQLLGLVIVGVSVLVIAATVRERPRTPVALPLFMLVFALLFDVMIALGRAQDPSAVHIPSWYTMPNVMLLVGLLAFALSRGLQQAATERVTSRAVVALAVVLVAGLVVVGTAYGYRRADHLHARGILEARSMANFDQVPATQRGCYASKYVWDGYPPQTALALMNLPLRWIRHDRLIMFGPNSYHHYQAEGLPPPPRCKPRGYFVARPPR